MDRDMIIISETQPDLAGLLNGSEWQWAEQSEFL
jgi:hypothetical protein